MVEPIAGGDSNVRDRRARISAKPGAKLQIYGARGPTNILNPLYDSGGLLFPYTPTINDTGTANYEMFDPVHTNQPFAAFKSVAAKEITIIGNFTTMNKQEARQNLAYIHFLRTVTKMHFGVKDPLRGTPPPILMFNAYGTAIYHNVPVIITTFNIEFPQDVDYVKITSDSKIKQLLNNPGERSASNPNGVQGLEGPIIGNVVNSGAITAWLPTRFIISLTMMVQNTPDRLRREFNLDDFRTGKLITKGGWV